MATVDSARSRGGDGESIETNWGGGNSPRVEAGSRGRAAWRSGVSMQPSQSELVDTDRLGSDEGGLVQQSASADSTATCPPVLRQTTRFSAGPKLRAI
jgi:hypothetical protein